jgi:hypothetical protein
MRWECDQLVVRHRGDEDVFAAVVGERFAVEAAVQGLQLDAGDLEEPEPFVFRCPP